TNLLARSKYLVASAIAPFPGDPPSAALAGVNATAATAIAIRYPSIGLFIVPFLRLQLIQRLLLALGDGAIGKLTLQLLHPPPLPSGAPARRPGSTSAIVVLRGMSTSCASPHPALPETALPRPTPPPVAFRCHRHPTTGSSALRARPTTADSPLASPRRSART